MRLYNTKETRIKSKNVEKMMENLNFLHTSKAIFTR